MYDVILAGAGPAGCTAAKILAGQGFRVLLAERRRLPRYKSCSGILIQKSLDLIRLCYGREVPLSVTCAPAENRGMIFTSDQGRELRFEQKGLNVWRSSFDHWLARQAGEAGAEVRDETSVAFWEDRGGSVSVVLRGKSAASEQARYLIDCGGVTGPARKSMPEVFRDTVTTFQTFNRGTIRLDPHYFYAYLQPELSAYDAWFNVKDHLLVLGVSGADPRELPYFYRRFLAYMTERHGLSIEEQTREEKWLMPRIRPGCPLLCGQGRVLLAGEAAGFLNPMGEGISAALESGWRAAAAVAEHFERPEQVLESYRRAAAPLKAYMERQWSFTGRIAGTFAEMI